MYGFNRSGKFIAWSDRFDMSSIPMLEASLDLPFPTGEHILPGQVQYSEGGIDLNDYFSTSEHPDPSKPFVYIFANERSAGKIKVSLGTPEAVRKYGEFIERFSQNPTIKQGNTPAKQANVERTSQWLRKEVNNYNSYMNKIGNSKRKEEAIKNYIQNCIYDITIDPINQNEAQNSVDFTVGPFKKLAAASPKAQEAIRNTPGAFTSTIYAINTNAVGKKGIGIAAVGLKSYFALTQYWNNVLEYGTQQEKDALTFNVRIAGQDYHALTNIHCENPDQFADKIISQAKNDSDYALQLSAILSLATDNAKELALSKLNCDTNTMGMWLYGLTIGVPFNTMAEIMTSNTGFQISSLLHGNMFNDEPSLSMNKVFDFIDKGPDNFLEKDTQDVLTYYSSLGIDLADPKSLNIKDIITQGNNLQQIQGIIHELQTNKSKQGVNINNINQMQSWLRLRAIINQDADIYEDFKTLAKGADEMKTLGQILHLNQGLYTSDTDTLKLVDKIENLISDRRYAITEDKSKYREDSSDHINLHRFIYEPNYRQAKISKYDAVAKVSFNLLNVLVQNPHYFSYIKMLDLQNNMNAGVSAKYRTIANLGQEKIEEYGAHAEEDKESILKRTSQFVDNYIINMWLRETGDTGINIMIPKGSTIYTDSSWDSIDVQKARMGLQFNTPTGTAKVSETGVNINLGTENGRATFKRWMEDIVIPNLQKGNLGQRDARGAYRPNKNSPILDNKFITGLTPVIFSNTPMKTTITGYSLGINMSPRSDNDKEIFDMYKHEFNKLKEDGYKYSVGNVGSPEYREYDLTDLFFLYNLVTFQNRLGETTLTRIFEDSRDQGIIPSYYDFINNIDRNSDIIIPDSLITSPQVDAQLAPVANPRTTRLRKFLHIDGATGRVGLYTKKSATEMAMEQEQNPEEQVSKFAARFIMESNYYPVRDVPNTSYSIDVSNKNTPFEKDISPENRQFIDRQGALQELSSITVDHNMGSIYNIEVNGIKINFDDPQYSPYKKYFKHVPTKTVFSENGDTIKVYDYKKLNDDIITLISQVC